MTTPKEAAQYLAQQAGISISANGQRLDTSLDHYTDVGNGQRLVTHHGPDIHFCFRWNSWLYWSGVRHQRDFSGELPRRAKEVIFALFDQSVTMYREAAQLEKEDRTTEASRLKDQADAIWKHAQRSEAASRIAAMLEMAKSEPGISIQPSELDTDVWSLNCLNGTIDLRTGHLRPHRREDYITKLAPVEYNPDAQLELWERFIREAIPDDETRLYVQKCVGYTLTGHKQEDLILLCHGEGGTGKSTFRESLTATLGDYAASADLETFTTRRDPHAPAPDLARLAGARLVAVSEVDTGGTMALLKRATGGDTIHTRSLHQETWEFIPQFTLWLMANTRPNVPDNDTGVWRRLREIPFSTKFNPPDPTIRTTLKTPGIAGAAILAWAVHGCILWQAEGLAKLPQVVQEATASYQQDMDQTAEWREEATETIASGWTPFKELFTAYLSWATDNGVRYHLGRKAFAQSLATRFPPKRGPSGVRGNSNIILKQARSGISQMPLRYEAPGFFHVNVSHGDNVENKSHEMPLQIQTKANDEMPRRYEGNVTEMPHEMPQALDPWDEADGGIA